MSDPGDASPATMPVKIFDLTMMVSLCKCSAVDCLDVVDARHHYFLLMTS